MKILKALFPLFLVLFVNVGSFGEENVPSVKSLVYKLEADIKNHRPRSVVQRDVGKILKAKEQLPINYVPELNYLLREDVEKIPSTEITKLKTLVRAILPVESGAKILIFLLTFYSFILFFQRVDLNVWIKRFLTLFSVCALALSAFLNFSLLLFFLLGVNLFLLYRLKKIKFLFALIVSGLLVYSATVVKEFSLELVKSPKFLYALKIERDGYAPPFLIERALGKGPKALLEEATCDLSLGSLGSVERVRKLAFSSPKLKAVKFNDLGYVEFLKKRYRRALTYFEKAYFFSKDYQILYNLYLTHSALLDVEEANRIRSKLEEKFNFSNAPPSPLLVHVPVGNVVEWDFHLPLLVSVLLGGFLGFVLVKVAPSGLKLDEKVLLIPGMKPFLGDRLYVFVVVSVTGVVLNALAGLLLCKV